MPLRVHSKLISTQSRLTLSFFNLINIPIFNFSIKQRNGHSIVTVTYGDTSKYSVLGQSFSYILIRHIVGNG